VRTATGLVAWRLPGAPQDSPLLAARVGAQRLQVDYGGFDRAYELAPATARRLRANADGVGVAVTAVAVNALNDLGVTSTDRGVRTIVETLVRRAVDAASAVGASAVLIPAFRRSAMHTPSDVMATAAFLVRVAQLAAGSGLVLVHENVLAPGALLTLRDATRGAGVRFLFDVGNLHEHGVDWRTYLAGAGPALHPEAHVKDQARRHAGDVPLGHGGVPLGRVVDALIRTPAVDCLVVETDHRDHDDEQIRADLTTLTHLIHDHGSTP
jgi:sugar phosphate isomerase/epimerase